MRTSHNLAFALKTAAGLTDNKLLQRDLFLAAELIKKYPAEPIPDFPKPPQGRKPIQARRADGRRQSIIKKQIPKTRAERREYFRKQFNGEV
jgi:hypothetical protein